MENKFKKTRIIDKRKEDNYNKYIVVDKCDYDTIWIYFCNDMEQLKDTYYNIVDYELDDIKQIKKYNHGKYIIVE